jgi:GNAT superfamily N-acetyltransferase
VSETRDPGFGIDTATAGDVPVILALIRELADYERLSHQVVATEADLARSLFGERPVAEAVVGRCADQVVAFALFFHNFSTFLGQPGIHLEDLYVRSTFRGRGFGRRMLAHLAGLALERGCGRVEWFVLDWNEIAIRSYRRAGARPLDDWTAYRLAGDALETLAAEGRDG